MAILAGAEREERPVARRRGGQRAEGRGSVRCKIDIAESPWLLCCTISLFQGCLNGK